MGALTFEEFDTPEKPTKSAGAALTFDEFDDAVEPRSYSDEFGRQIGLTARAGIQGVGDFADMLASPLRYGMNQVGANIQGRTGEAVANLMRLPKAETRIERIGEAGAEAMAPAGMFLKGGQLMSKAAPPVVRAVGELLKAAPKTNIGLSGVAGVSAQVAEEEGAGAWGQMAAALGVPIAMMLSIKATGATLARARDILSSVLTDKGATRSAGRVATDVAGQAAPAIPGTLRAGENPQTAAQAALPAGSAEFSGLERLAGVKSPSVFGPFGKVEGHRAQWLKDEWKNLNATTGPVREKVLQAATAGQSGSPLNAASLKQQVMNTRANPDYSNRTSQGVLNFIDKELNRIADPLTGNLNGARLYGMRKDIGLKIEQMATKQKWDKSVAMKILRDFQKSMDLEIEKASGMVGSKGGSVWQDDYLGPFAARAKQLTAIDDAVEQSAKMGAAGAQEARNISRMDEMPIAFPNVLSRPVMVVNFLMRVLQGKGAGNTGKEIARLMRPENKAELATLIEKELALRAGRQSLGQMGMQGARAGSIAAATRAQEDQ
jgi:hypothetical protein